MRGQTRYGVMSVSSHSRSLAELASHGPPSQSRQTSQPPEQKTRRDGGRHGMQALVDDLRKGDAAMQERTALLLASHSNYNAGAVAEQVGHGVVSALLEVIKSGRSEAAQQHAATALGSLSRGGALNLIGRILMQSLNGRTCRMCCKSSSPSMVNRVGSALKLGVKPLLSSGEDAVFAVALGYNVAATTRFLGSLRRTGYSGAIELLVGALEAPDALAAMDAHGVRTHRIPTSGWCCGGDDRVRSKVFFAERCLHGRYRRCLLTDFRDVFFQRPPFERFPAGATIVANFESARAGVIRSNPYMERWIRTCLQVERVPEQIGSMGIICSGTIMGTPEGIAALGRQLNHTSEQLPHCREVELDQALLNVVLYRWQHKRRLVPHLDGQRVVVQLQGGGAPVNTIGFVAPLLRNATSGEVLESDSRTASAIVHQYDRHPAPHSHVNRLAGVPHTMAMEELLDHDILRRFCAQEGAQSHAKACRPWRCPWRSSSSRGSWWPW